MLWIPTLSKTKGVTEMSLESKAKTREQLQVYRLQEGHWIVPYSIIDNQLKEKYVPLEDAQKEIFALGEQLVAVTKWNNELADMIEGANNTLKQARDFLEAIDDDKLSANHVLSLISDLEETLHTPQKKQSNCVDEIKGEK